MLDDFAGHGPECVTLTAAYTAWRDARAAESEAESAQQASRREADYLRHAVAELETLAPEVGEEERCAAERARLMNGQKIAEALESARAAMTTGEGVAARLRAAQGVIARSAPLAVGALDALAGALERAAIEAEEAEAAMAAAGGLESDSGRLEAVEARLFALRNAARKHGTAPDSLGALLVRLRDDLDLAVAGGERLATLKQATEAAHRAYREAAAALSRARRGAARALDASVAEELGPLKLGRARFGTALETGGDGTATGIDRCRFMLATDPAADLAPLAKIASGGERARLLLALRVCLARAAGLSTLVFDEIDRGIGGAVASAVGERLAKLAQDVQVLVVTHSPQVAARGDRHYRVSRGEGEEGPATAVALLAGDARREEIARMLSGARITREARAAAHSLLRAG